MSTHQPNPVTLDLPTRVSSLYICAIVLMGAADVCLKVDCKGRDLPEIHSNG